MKAAVVQAVVDRAEDADKEKKKKRRSNRRSKQNNSSTSALSGSANEIRGEASECLGNGRTPNDETTSLKQPPLDMRPPDEYGLTKSSNFAFSSLPTMHINGYANPRDVQSSENQHFPPSDSGGRIFATCPESIAYGGSSGILANKDFPSHSNEGYVQSKYFTPHWSMETVNDALENGVVFKALFRVNAHNRLEAYCKIDGVPTDILIGGLADQNRAVEGDIVVIKVDPLPLWTKMKGSAGACNNSAPVENCNSQLEDNEIAGYNCKGKAKVDDDHGYANHRSCLLPEGGSWPQESTSLGESIHSEPIGQSSYDHVAGRYPLAPDSVQDGSSEQNGVRIAVERMCAMISSFPSKRPTGRVVAIIEGSPRRESIVGFLNVKQWISYREFCRTDMKKNKTSSLSNYEYIQMTPTDPRYPKMVVLVRNLPDPIKKRLEDSDATVRMELFAARIDEWAEESTLPQAFILHAFGRGGEVQPQIEAILFENAINSSKFSPESLSCLPHLPWEVPQVELRSRKDLCNLCIFTIDPSSATDLDDALSVEKLSNDLFRVGIHIADASYFVLPGTPLDEEAQSRSTSVYMSWRKLPMLPPVLSENIGSLNPGVERLAFSIFFDINQVGDVVDRWIGRTVIKSCCKLSYEQAQDIIDEKFNLESYSILGNGCPQLHGHFEWFDVIRSVKTLHEISKTLREKRFSDGALHLESSKVVILFDEYGAPYDSAFSDRKESNFLVEEFMLLANRTVAEVISRAFPDSALLRRHPEPNMRKLREFEAFCSKHGLEFDTSSGQFHHSLERIRDKLKDDSVLFNILMNYASRPMQLATYFCSGELKGKENDWGHYGLAVPLYTHFTSPLRRYPDIVVQRTLAAAVEAEELYLKHQRTLNNFNRGDEFKMRCFTGIYFDKDAAESRESREALSAAAIKHRVPCSELLADVAAYCNERKLASRHVKDACDKLYMWALLKKKEILLSEARVLGLGPRFMSIYVHQLAAERRIYYDEVEGLMVEWLEATSTLVLSLRANRRSFRRGSSGNWRALEDVALVVSPSDLKAELGADGKSCDECATTTLGDVGVATHSSEPTSNCCPLDSEIEPVFFPLTVRLLSTIPVVLHAVGGDDGPLDIGARLYMSSYLC